MEIMGIEDIKEAIEVLEDASAEMLMETGDKDYYGEAIAVLRQAIEQAEHVHAIDTSQERVDEIVKQEHDRAVELGQAYERGWNAALAQQEPVAWASSLDFDDDDQEIIPAKDKGKLGTNNCDIPLYTTPKQWVTLTDEEVSEVIDNVLEGGGWLDVARALEAAIKRKNA